MQICVSMPKGEKLKMEVYSDQYISTLKQMIAEKKDIPINSQLLILNGKKMDDNTRFNNIKLDDKSTFDLFIIKKK